MLIALPIARHEREQAERLFAWIKELGAGRNHDAVLILAPDADGFEVPEGAFKSVCSHIIPMEAGTGWNPGTSGDATTANNMFLWGSLYCDEVLKRPFLWHEVDAVPTRATAYDEIEAEYQACGKPFMGDKVNHPPFPLHMSGVAVYPVNIPAYSITLRNAGKQAWDLAASGEVMPKAHFTQLIQHRHWQGKPCQAAAEWNGKAALFHQEKCSCLYNRLRGVVPNPEYRVASHELESPTMQLRERTITEKDYIAALVDIASKSPLAKGRIKKQLRAKGF